MPLININTLDAATVADELHAIDGITPTIAEGVAEHMATSGLFETQEDFLKLLKKLKIQKRYLDLIAKTIVVTPIPLFAPPIDLFFKGAGETTIESKLFGRKRTKGIWRWRIQGLKLRENGNIEPEGAEILDDLGIKLEFIPNVPNKKDLVFADGEVSFLVKKTGKCNPKIHSLDYKKFPKTTTAKIAYGIPKALQNREGITVTVTDPTVTARTTTEVTITNDGACARVTVTTSITFTPGKAKVKLTVQKVSKEFDVTLGTAFSDAYSATYELCCCTWDKSDPELKEKDVEFGRVTDLDRNEDPDFQIKKCATGLEFGFKQTEQANPASKVDWSIEALEGGCKFITVLAGRQNQKPGKNEVLTIFRNKKGPPIQPKTRKGVSK